jgi:quinol monooxygenase YgiN
MFARSNTISGDPAKIEEGIAFIRHEVMPTMMAMDGCIGMSLVVRREDGRCIATSCWESMEAMRAADDTAKDLRANASTLMGAVPQVDLWEVAVMHRDHLAGDGSCCRITWGRASDMDLLVDRFRDTVLPMIEQADGFCSASLFVNRDLGLTCGTATFDSREAMDASRERAAANRERAAALTGMEFLEIGEFELLEHHLRIPELV